MKIIKILMIILLTGSTCYAQHENSATVIHLDERVKIGPQPLYVIVHDEKEYEMDSSSIKNNVLKPDNIKSLKVVKPPESDARYKEKGKNGVILITLKEDNNSAAFKKLKQYLTLLKTEEE